MSAAIVSNTRRLLQLSINQKPVAVQLQALSTQIRRLRQ